MERTYVNIPEETKLYASEIATRRKDITGEHGLSGFIEGDIPKEGRAKVQVPLPCAEGGEQKYEVYFVDVNDLDIVEEDTEQVSSLTEEEEFEKSNLTEEEVEILHENTMKHSTPIGGSYFDDELVEGDYINDPISYIKPTVRLKAGVTYDFNGQRLGNLPNQYYLESENNDLAIIYNISTKTRYTVLKTNLIGH